MKTRSRWLCLALGLAITLGIHAHSHREAAEKHWKFVSTKALQSMQEGETEYVLVNVLPKIIHDHMHIPGSVNIPLGAVATSTDLPEDRDTLVIFYCMGRQCRYSPKAADIAESMGFSNVLVYRDGILGWRRAGLPVNSLATYPQVDVPQVSATEVAGDPEVWLLDCRPIDHFSRGHIKGSTNIDLEVLHERIHLIPKDRRIVLIDHKGKLTLTTGRFLVSQGIKNVARLDGGINAWAKSDLPLVKNREEVSIMSPQAVATEKSLP